MLSTTILDPDTIDADDTLGLNTENKATDDTANELNVFSTDADGCIFHHGYFRAKAQGKEFAYLTENKPLLDHIAERSKKESFLMDGSSRQSHLIDKAAVKQYNTESIFAVLPKIAEHLKSSEKSNIAVDPYLTSDSFSHAPEGQIFAGKEETDSPDEKSKILILYAQMHHIAAKFPGKKIQFHFYDDFGYHDGVKDHDLLGPLGKYFKQHPDLIPPNLTLNLYQYDGRRSPTLTDSIPGSKTGIIDYQYGTSIIKFHELCNQPIDESYHALNLPNIDEITAKFKTYRLNPAKAATASVAKLGVFSKTEQPTDSTEKPIKNACGGCVIL